MNRRKMESFRIKCVNSRGEKRREERKERRKKKE
jgi:hypothetical protein